MTYYYVDPASGSDTNAGGTGDPFLTVQAALDVAEHGDTILLRDGTHTDANVLRIDKDLKIAADTGHTAVVFKCETRIVSWVTFDGFTDTQDEAASAWAKHTVAGGRLSLDNIQANVTTGDKPFVFVGSGGDLYLRPKNTPMLIDYSSVNEYVISIEGGRLWSAPWSAANKTEIRGGKTGSMAHVIDVYSGEVLFFGGVIKGSGNGVSGSKCIYAGRGSNIMVYSTASYDNLIMSDAETGIMIDRGSRGYNGPEITLTNITTGFDSANGASWGGSSGGASELSDLTDVDVSSATDGQYLKRVGGAWEGDTLTVD